MQHIYARISTDDKKQTIETQRTLLKNAYPAALFMYCDEGVSGSSRPDSRTGWNQLVSMLQPGDSVHVLEISRISRDLIETLEVFRQLARMGVTITSEREGTFDLNDPEDEFRLSLLASLNRREKGVIQKRVKLGMAAAKARGVHCGRKSDGDTGLALDLLREGYSVTDTVLKSGVSRATVYRLRKEL
ncbi:MULTISPECIES: recombinase family protein [unclassified Leclercia]|uniref:Recombinase family protein n=1 Tax=Leclercia barmai TaxID=2785629 RepID=A0ABS7RT16_9ENTR|nr:MULTISPECIES: recombinase family protein [unclassified Leclercia]MBZ0057462.1 recombinase family protein [Leclercia sp. EMC7]MCM5695626.1 recombinase family protein [Leclercia sp. LTM01]MCM5700034.1 recombinase family protein [Leclercia sp. LTM14]